MIGGLKMKRIHVLGVIILTAVISISSTFLVMKQKHGNAVKSTDIEELDSEQLVSIKEDEKEEFESTIDIHLGWENVFHSKMIDEWKSGDEPFVDNLVQEVIQQMTHQKIIADEKQGSIMVTPERIETLLQMVEENEDVFEHSEKYVDILNRWQQGDFTSVVNDHNDMWWIQGAKKDSIATGIATKEQESNYILRVFGIPVEKQN